MNYHVDNETDFIAVLKDIRDNDTIWCSPFEAEFTGLICTKQINLVGFNPTLLSRHYYTVEDNVPYLTITKSGAIVEPFIVGSIPDVPTTWQQDGIQTGICIDGAEKVELYDASAEKVNYTAYLITDCEQTIFYGGQFHDCATPKEKYGFGHPIFFSQKAGQVGKVYNADFSNNRHCIASSYDDNIVEVYSCNFTASPFSKHILDRHGKNQKGGRDYIVKYCVFNAPNNYAYDFAQHSGTVLFENNIFSRSFGKNGRIGGIVETEGLALYNNNLYV